MMEGNDLCGCLCVYAFYTVLIRLKITNNLWPLWPSWTDEGHFDTCSTRNYNRKKIKLFHLILVHRIDVPGRVGEGDIFSGLTFPGKISSPRIFSTSHYFFTQSTFVISLDPGIALRHCSFWPFPNNPLDLISFRKIYLHFPARNNNECIIFTSIFFFLSFSV